MNDIRLRLLAASVLSVAAFFSMVSALAAMLWWLIFTPRLKRIPQVSVVFWALGMIIIISAFLQYLNGTGLSYGLRMWAILLIAVWVWSEQQPGDCLSLFTWLLSGPAGFELGLIAELGMQSFNDLLDDFSRMRTAWAIKRVPLSFDSIPVAGLVLVHGALQRANDTADLLAIRGYRHGGSFCPSFRPFAQDIPPFAAAMLIALLAVIPVGEFFILLH